MPSGRQGLARRGALAFQLLSSLALFVAATFQAVSQRPSLLSACFLALFGAERMATSVAPVTQHALLTRTQTAVWRRALVLSMFAIAGECVVQALARGAKVTVLARTPSKLAWPPGTGGEKEGSPIADPNLTVVQGSVTDPAAVARCITKDPCALRRRATARYRIPSLKFEGHAVMVTRARRLWRNDGEHSSGRRLRPI